MKRSLLFVCLLYFSVSVYSEEKLLPPRLIQNPANDDEYFFNFRLINFTTDTEPLIKESFGNELKLEHDKGFWEHNSYTSCAVSFSINGRPSMPAKTDDDGYVSFELLTVRHLKANSTITRSNYESYTFAVAGYPVCTVATNEITIREAIALSDPSCNQASGIEAIEKNKVSVYLNPVSENLYLCGLAGNETIYITDSSGRLLLTHKATNDNEMIQVNNFSSGLYFNRIEGIKRSETSKIIINR